MKFGNFKYDSNNQIPFVSISTICEKMKLKSKTLKTIFSEYNYLVFKQLSPFITWNEKFFKIYFN